MLEAVLEFFTAVSEGLTSDAEGNPLGGGALARGLAAVSQLFLWLDLFESDELNYTVNVVLGVVEALLGTVTISMGQRQLDLTSSEGGGLPRLARRTAGEVVQTLLGHLRCCAVLRRSGAPGRKPGIARFRPAELPRNQMASLGSAI
jgi:hypothetical protein